MRSYNRGGGGFPYCSEWLLAWFRVASWANTRGGPVIIPIMCIPDGLVCFIFEDNRFRSIAWSSVSYATLFAETITSDTVRGDHGRNMVALL